MKHRMRAVGWILGSSRSPRPAALLLALTCALAILPATEGSAGALHRRQVHLTLRLARTGHQTNTLGSMRLPRRLAGYYISMRVTRADGRSLPRIGQGRVLVLTGPDRKALAKLILSSRYSPRTGRLRFAVTVKNLRVRRYRSRGARLSATVTVGYRP